MRKLYLHLGFHRTASSSFQSTCFYSIERLLDQGFLYPLFSVKHPGLEYIANHSFPIYSLFCEKPEAYHINVSYKVKDAYALNKEYETSLKKFLSYDGNVILSGEDIAQLSPSELDKFKSFLGTFDFEIIPIALLRSPYEYHCSSIQKSIMTGVYRDFSQFGPQFQKIEKIQAAFPSVCFVPFKMACKHEHGPVGYLFKMMNISCEGIKFTHSNVGVSNVQTRLQNELNKAEPAIRDGVFNENHTKISYLDDLGLKLKFLLTAGEYENIKDACQRENYLFAKTLGDDFKDENIKFSNVDESLKELAAGLAKNIASSGNTEQLMATANHLKKIDINLSHVLLSLVQQEIKKSTTS